MDKRIFNTSIINRLIVCLGMFILAYQIWCLEFDPFARFFLIYGICLLVWVIVSRYFRMEIEEKGIRFKRWLFPELFIPLEEIVKIDFKYKIFHRRKIYVTYRIGDKLKEQGLGTYLQINIDTLEELCRKTNLPVPEKYLKYREKIERRNPLYREIPLFLAYFLLLVVTLYSYKNMMFYGINPLYLAIYLLIFLGIFILLKLHRNWEIYQSTVKMNWLNLIAGFYIFFIVFWFQGIIDGNIRWFYFGYSFNIGVIIILLYLIWPSTEKINWKRVTLFGIILLLILNFTPLILVPHTKVKKIATITEEYAPIGRIFWTPQEKIMILPPKGSLYLIDPKTEKTEKIQLKDPSGVPFRFYHPSYSPDKKYFFTEGTFYSEKTIYSSYILFDLERLIWKRIYSQSEKEEDQYWSHDPAPYKSPWSPDGRYLIYNMNYFSKQPGKEDCLFKSFQLYDVSRNTSYRIYQTKDNLSRIHWMKEGTIYFLSYSDKVFTRGKGKEKTYFTLWKFRLDPKKPNQPIRPEKCFTAEKAWWKYEILWDGKYLAGYDRGINGQLTLWDMQGRKIREFPEGIYPRDWHPAEEKFLYSIQTGKYTDIYEWDILKNQPRKIVRENKILINYIYYSADGKRIDYKIEDYFLDTLISVKTDGTDWKVVRLGTGTQPMNVTSYYINDFALDLKGNILAYLVVPKTQNNNWEIRVYTAEFN